MKHTKYALVALALIAAGGLGYLSRRRAAAGDTGPPDDLAH